MPTNESVVEDKGKFTFPSRCGQWCIIIRIPNIRCVKSLEGLQIQACINNSTINSMDNKKKGYNLRALFITLCLAQPEPHSVEPAVITALARVAATRQDIAVSVAALQPLLPWNGQSHAFTNNEQLDSADADKAAIVTHILRWPVVARRGLLQVNKIWPGAGFAFPFIASQLVNILHATPFDIMIASDIQSTGFVACRLHEIVGVPYVIIASNSTALTKKRQSPGQKARLTAILRDAEFVLRSSSDAKTTGLQYPGIRFRDFDFTDSSEGKFLELLREAAQQSQESFDW